MLAAVGLLATAIGPFAIGAGPLRVSVGTLYKPMSLAAVFALIALAASSRLRAAARRSSPLAFYVLATVAMWVLALGPTARLFGERVLYKAPYAWLMLLPGFGEALRAPARFAMLAALTLAVAAALAVARLPSSFGPSTRLLAWLAVVAGVTADGWIERLPLPAPPPQIAAMNALPAETVVLELPLGTFEDIAAMYRSMSHGHRLANGYSGIRAGALHGASRRHRRGSCRRRHGPGDDRRSRRRDGGHARGRGPGRHDRRPGPRCGTIARGGRRRPPHPRASRTRRAPGDWTGPPDWADRPPSGRPTSATSADGDTTTAWSTPEPQAGGEQLVVELDAMREVAAVRLGLGKFAIGYPRVLAVDPSTDGSAWTRAWHGDTAAATMQAALADPAAVPVAIGFPPAPTRFVRLTQEGAAPHPWAVAELAVLGPPAR